MSVDYVNWLLIGGVENVFGNFYVIFDFSSDLQVWINLVVYCFEVIWGINLFSVLLIDDDNGYYWDVNCNCLILGVCQFILNEVGGLDILCNINCELFWDWSVGLCGCFVDCFDWSVMVGCFYYCVEEWQNVVDEQKLYDYFFGLCLGIIVDGEVIYVLNELCWWNLLMFDQYWQMGIVVRNCVLLWVNQVLVDIIGELFQGWVGLILFVVVVEVVQQGYYFSLDLCVGVDFDLQNVDCGGGECICYLVGVEFKILLLESVMVIVVVCYDCYGNYKVDDSSEVLDIGSQKEIIWNVGLEWCLVELLLVCGLYVISFYVLDMYYLLGQLSSFEVQIYDCLCCIQSGVYLVNNCGVGNIDVWYIFDVNCCGMLLLCLEIGDLWMVGFVWDVMFNLLVSVDYWVIKLEDMIVDVGVDEVLVSEVGCLIGKNIDGMLWVNLVGGDYCVGILVCVNCDSNGCLVLIECGLFNLVSWEVCGIDLIVCYCLEIVQWGSFQLGLNYINQILIKEQCYVNDLNLECCDCDLCSKLCVSLVWQCGNWNVNVYVDCVGLVLGVCYYWGIDCLDNFGGCLLFVDGYVFSDSFVLNCLELVWLLDGLVNLNFNVGQQILCYFGWVGLFIIWNVNVGYQVIEYVKVNVYVNNVFNLVSWNYKDLYKLDYDFVLIWLLSVVGCEFVLEYVFIF